MKTSKLMYLLSGLTALTAFVITAFLLHMIQDVSNRANELDLARSKTAVVALKQAIREQSRQVLEDNARWDDAVENTYGKANQEWLRDTWGYASAEGIYDSVFVLDETFKTIAGFSSGERSKFDAAAFFGPPLYDLLKKLPKKTDKLKSASAFFRTLKGTAIVSAITIIPHSTKVQITSGERRTLIFSKTLTAEMINRLGEQSALEGLKLNQPSANIVEKVELIGGDNRPVGALSWVPANPGDAAKAEIQQNTLLAIGAMIACMLVLTGFTGRLSSKLHKSEQLAWQIANTDSLTKLPNRFATTASLNEKISKIDGLTEGGLTVMFADVDGFKEVNDTYGHQIGDELLKIIASGLSDIATKNSATVSRLGGDEFAFILEGEASRLRAEDISSAALKFLSTPIDLGGRIIRVGISIGIATHTQSNVEASEILRWADVAMYAAKSQGKNQFCHYEPQLDRDRNERVAMANLLGAALEAKKLTAVYQPVVDAWSHKITGVEALARWQLETGEWIAPDLFVSVAEEFGLIDELGKQILTMACADIAPLDNLNLSVNISPAQFRNPQFVERNLAIIDSSGLARNRLELEVTEGYLIEHQDRAQPIIEHLQAEGLQVALDDFGTGYSSIGYLRQYRFNKLKLDKSLIEGMATDESARSIIQVTTALARSMNMTVTAEGIEHEEEANLLRLAGCDSLQGFHFGCPQSLNGIKELLKNQDQKDKLQKQAAA